MNLQKKTNASKLLSAVLTICVMFNGFSVTAFAAGDETAESALSNAAEQIPQVEEVNPEVEELNDQNETAEFDSSDTPEETPKTDEADRAEDEELETAEGPQEIELANVFAETPMLLDDEENSIIVEICGNSMFSTTVSLKEMRITNDTINQLAAKIYEENKSNCVSVHTYFDYYDAPDLAATMASLDDLSEWEKHEQEYILMHYLPCESIQKKLKNTLNADSYNFFGMRLYTYTFDAPNEYSLKDVFRTDETDDIIELEIPMNFDNKDSFSFARCLNDEVEVLTESPNQDGEYAVFDKVNGVLRLGIKKGLDIGDTRDYQSRYAIGWNGDYLTNESEIPLTLKPNGNGTVASFENATTETIEIQAPSDIENCQYVKAEADLTITSVEDLHEQDPGEIPPLIERSYKQKLLKEQMDSEAYNFFDTGMKMRYYQENSESPSEDIISSVTEPIVIEIPFDFRNKYDIKVAFVANRASEAISLPEKTSKRLRNGISLLNADDTDSYFVCDEENGTITIALSTFGSYAIGWSNKLYEVTVNPDNATALKLNDMTDAGVEQIAKEEKDANPDVARVFISANISAISDVSKTDLSTVPPFAQTNIKDQRAIKEAADSESYDFINISLLSYRYDSLDSDIHSSMKPLAKSSSLMTLTIPVNTKGKQNFKYTRMYNGKAETLTETPNADGEYAKLENGVLTLRINKYGNAAVSWDKAEEQEQQEEEKPIQKPSTTKPAVPNTADCNDTLFTTKLQ